MGRLTLAGPLGLTIAAAALPAYADVGVPSAAKVVHEAGLIVAGTLAPAVPLAVVPTRVLKGDTAGHRSLLLADPTSGRFLNFNLGKVPSLVGGAPTVVLGRFDAARAVLSLTWLDASFWPRGHRYDTFDSSTLESTIAFIERLLEYSAVAAKDPDSVVRMLVADIGARRAAPALAYLEIGVQADLGATTAAQIRAVCAVALSRTVPDAASVRQFANLLPVFPASLAAPLALDWAAVAAEPEVKRLHDALRAMLGARGAQLPPGSDTASYHQAYGGLAPKLRRADAKRMLTLFDAVLPSLRDTYADALMAALTGGRPAEPLATLDPQQRKAVWRRETDAMPD